MYPFIRPFEERDRDSLIDICRRTSAFDPADLELILELVNIYLHVSTQKDYACLAAVDNQDNLLGFLCYGPTPLTEGTYDLYWIVIDPDCSHQGIGRSLMSCFEQKVLASGGRLIIIETSSIPAYLSARSFYQKLGYALPEVIKDFYRPGEDRLTFVKVMRP